MNILAIQTAFAGDLILTLPMIAEAHRLLPGAQIDVVAIPATAGLLENHPAIRRVVVYDKRKGMRAFREALREIRTRKYDACLAPHRSLRSAALSFLSGAPVRASFDRSAGGALHNRRVPYDAAAHEVRRNLALLQPLGLAYDADAPARLYPSDRDKARAREAASCEEPFVCVAPGSVWPTKRWTREGFIALSRALTSDYRVFLIGGKDDASLCGEIAGAVGHPRCVSLAGGLRWLETAALIGDAALVVSNDSAPVHVASAMSTPVVEIYGATSPAFGFTPWHTAYRIVQREDLACKPCAIHGGKECPIRTFECMRGLAPGDVLAAAREILPVPS